MLKILGEEYIREDYHKADVAQKKYEELRRRPYQPMEQYLRELKIAKRRLEVEDKGTKIRDISFSRKC